MSILASHLYKVLKYAKHRIEDYINAAGKCCKLKECMFSAAEMPDYNDIDIQYLYIIRYYMAYLCEYRYIYGKILSSLKESEISVLSIGAGCLLDLDGLNYAMYDTGTPKGNVDYSGVDVADWKYKVIVQSIQNEAFKMNVSELEPFHLNKNVLMFSKSIIDINERDFDIFLKRMEQHNYRYKNMVLASVLSPRENEYCIDVCKLRFRRVAEVFRSKGYASNDTMGINAPFDGGNVYWAYIFDGARIPQFVVEYTKELSSLCPVNRRNGHTCKTDCTDKLNRFPVMKADNFRYQILRMKR